MTEDVTQIQPLSEETFGMFRRLIYEKTNIAMRDSKQIMVSNRLRKRVIALKLAGFDEYYRYLTHGLGREEEMANFIAAVSTNETYFFRENGHFDAMRDQILPKLFARKRRLRIWCAGCSTGEEPYTLRIVLEEGKGARWEGEAEIVATDISHEVIARARLGVFGQRSIRFVPPEVLGRYFVMTAEGLYQVSQEIRDGVDFRVHTLLKDPPPARLFDVIFCRNVMIYFDKATQKRLVDEYFADVLDAGGYLCIGHSESLSGKSEKFRYQRALRSPIYQKATEEAADDSRHGR